MSERTGDPTAESLPPSMWADLEGLVHYVDYGGADGSPLLVLIHGLGGSLLGWAAVAPALAARGRVLALDLAGFGRTPGSPRPVTLSANRALLHQFLLGIAGTPAILIGHSMGGTIAAMQAAQHAQTVAGLVLINPAVPWQIEDQINPRLAGIFAGMAALKARPGTRPGRSILAAFERVLKEALLDSYERIPDAALRAVEQNLATARARLADRGGSSDMRSAASSLALNVARKSQFTAMLDAINVPVLLLHGDQDRLVPISAARAAARAHPTWGFEIAAGIGHAPQLEAPDWTVDHIRTWLREGGALAAERSRAAHVPQRRPAPHTFIKPNVPDVDGPVS